MCWDTLTASCCACWYTCATNCRQPAVNRQLQPGSTGQPPTCPPSSSSKLSAQESTRHQERAGSSKDIRQKGRHVQSRITTYPGYGGQACGMWSPGGPQRGRYPAQQCHGTAQWWRPSERRLWREQDLSSHQQARTQPADRERHAQRSGTDITASSQVLIEDATVLRRKQMHGACSYHCRCHTTTHALQHHHIQRCCACTTANLMLLHVCTQGPHGRTVGSHKGLNKFLQRFVLLTCTDVMDPLLVVVIRSCRPPRSVARVGW